MLVFSDREPPGWGPRRVTRDEIRESLGAGWRIESIDEASMETIIEPATARCWLTIATRL
jgi:hypothetical protein